jgi:phospholipase A1
MRGFILSLALMLSSTLYAAKPLKPTTAEPDLQSQVKGALDTITPAQNSALNSRWEQARAANNTLSITLYRPTYVLPFYNTSSPYYGVYNNSTPDHQKVMHNEFKSQLSFYVPVVSNLFYDPRKSLNIAYTQLNFWQVYASSQYFRETNYEPEVFVEDHFHPNWLIRAGVNHQSNGRGGDLERSWNRVIETLQFSGENWLMSVSVWQMIFKGQSSDLHNADIAYYLGHESILFSYKIKEVRASIQVQNLESGLKRGSVTTTLSYPVSKHISLYGEYFKGYGQSLIEYNHSTQGVGIGIAFNDWI